MNWDMLAIGDFCRTGSGGTPSRKKADRYFGGNIPWVKSGELREGVITKTEETITQLAVIESSAKFIPKGALLVAMYGATIGRVAKLGIDATSNQAVCHILPDESLADMQYMFYALQAQVPHWLGKGVGGAQPNISQEIIKNTVLPLPPLEEQRRIAAILDKAENINSLLKARQAEADLLMQSVFIDLFGNPKEEPGNSLFYIATLGECCVLFSGGTLPDGEENTGQEGGFLLLKVSDMNLPGNEERIKTSKLWASSPGAKSATCPAGSVVIPKRGGAIGTNKKRVVDRDAVLDPNLMAIAPRDQTITTEFLRGWFSFLDLSSITSGSSVPQLNKQDLSPLRLAIPHLKAQERYKELAIRALSMSDRLQKQSDNSHVLLGALQRKCFGGNNYE